MFGDQSISNRLISAVSAGNLETARELINSFGLSYSKAWSDGYVLLRDALKRGHTEIAELLLTRGSKVNSKSSEYKPTDTPLHFAALYGNVNIVKMLLNKGAKINAKNQGGKTPLFNVINNINYGDKQDKMEVTELLVKGGADVNTIDNSGTSPLHVAIDRGCSKIVQLLLEYGAYINCTTFAPLYYAVESGSKELTTLLLSRGAKVDGKTEYGITPLHIAAQEGYAHIAAELLNHGACINSLTLREGCTPLHLACEGYMGPLHISERSNFEETVKCFLNKGADVNANTKDNLTPLHIATKRRNTAIVKLLLQHGAKVDNEDKDGKTVLQFAVERGNLMIVEDVLKYCPDVNNESNRSSLKVAVCGNAKEIVQALLEYGLNVDPKDKNNPEYFHAAIKKGYLKIVDDLLKYGTDVNILYNTTYEEGFTPLHTAAKYEQHVIAKLLISYEADINAQDKSGKTPIFYAIQNADLKMTRLLLTNKANVKDNPELLNNAVKKVCLEIVEALLQHDADVNYSDKYGRTPLHFTILMENEGFIDEFDTNDNAKLVLKRFSYNYSFTSETSTRGKMAELLLSKGANVNSQTKSGITTLCAAIQKGCTKVVEALLEYNANLNSAVKTDILPLHLSVQIGNVEITRMLLNKGADVNAKQNDGTTALHIAVKERHNVVVKILLEYGAKVDSKSQNDMTPLHWGARKGNKEVVETLLKFGADIESTDVHGNTALHIASKFKHAEVVETLLAYGSDINAVRRCNLTPLDYAVNTTINFPDSNRYGSFNTFTALKCQIIKMKTANLYVSEQNLLSIWSNDQMKDYEDECEKEIEKMKSEKFNYTNISFYDILARDTSSLANYMRNENVVQVLRSDDYISKFPIYASMIKIYFRKVMKRKELLDQVNDIYFLFNNLLELPYACTDKILSYLSDEDLRIMMDACNKPLSDSNPHMH